MADTALLPVLIAAPIVGAGVCALMPKGRASALFALGTSLFTLAAAVWVAFLVFGHPAQGWGEIAWGGGPLKDRLGVADIGFSVRLGCDSISLWLILLTAFLTPLALLSAGLSISGRLRAFASWMLLLEGALIGVFLARDLLLFYIFFELTLVPTLFLIGIWGGENRREAAGKFFIYTFAGSVFLLLAVLYIGISAGTLDMTDAFAAVANFTPREQFWVCLALLIGFLIKTPVFPLHTWQPLAYSEAPLPGTVMMAAVLGKLGTYGILRLVLPGGFSGGGGAISNTGVLQFVGVLAVIGILYGALVAWSQRDFYRLLAYSSLSHLGFCILGLLSMTQIGLSGAVLYMVNHGITTAALFFTLGMIARRLKSRDLTSMSGLFKAMPILSVFFVLFAMSSIGLPGTNGFVSEFLTLLGTFTSSTLGVGFAVTAGLGMILAACYMLHLTGRVFFGPLLTPEARIAKDIGIAEISILAPLATAVLLLGVMPNLVLRPIESAVARQLPQNFALRQIEPAPVDRSVIQKTPAAVLAD